jgi:hypothetical protein
VSYLFEDKNMNSDSDRQIDFSRAKEPPASLNLDAASEAASSEKSQEMPEPEESKPIDRQMVSALIPGGAVTSAPSIDRHP